MSRNSKWKLEKTKVKVVFRLQFHATHIPQTGWDKLFISFISADTGKATAKTTKANVRNGTCKWADPIYETTRLLQDSKSKQYDEKFYKIVLATGSSRASVLGEATINLADYADALKPSSVALPLHGCNFGTILHTTIQLLTSKTGFREFEQQRELRENRLQSGVGSHGESSTDEISNDQNDKVTARGKFKTDGSELSSVEEEVNLNEYFPDSNSAGFDHSSNTSECQYAEKHENDCSKSSTSGDIHVRSHSQSPHAEKGDPSDHLNSSQHSSVLFSDNEFAAVCEENNRLRESLELAESSIFNLKMEVSSLQGLADDLGGETQKLSHLLAAEISSAEELTKEVSVMKSECLKFKDDVQELKFNSQTLNRVTSGKQVGQLDHNVQVSKGFAVAEAKIRELQNKMHIDVRDTNFVYLELEDLFNILQDVKHGINEATTMLNVLPSERTDEKEIREVCTVKNKEFASGNGFGLDLCQPESVLQHFSMIPSVSEVANPVNAIDAMKGQIFDLVRELDEGKVEKEVLTRKMDQMECYYESLIHELEENQKLMLAELQHLRNEHSTCIYTLSASRAEIESIREDMSQQMLQFVNERRELDALNKELERRATTSESALRRARLNYSIAVDKLQKDLELLSSQVVSMFETNESLMKQAIVEPSLPHLQEDQKVVQNPQDCLDNNSSQHQNPNLGVRKRLVDGDLLVEDLKRSFCLQEELYQNVEKELIEMYPVNLNLDIYSKVLQESLLEADADIKIMKKKMDELAEELEISTDSQDQLMIRLQKATEDIHTLNEYKSSCVSQCSDLALQNQLLEDKLESISKENFLLTQKLNESETLMTEYRSYQSKLETCLAENAELSLSLKQEALENEKLQSEISSVKEDLMVLKAESSEVTSLKKNLEEDINFVRDKIAGILESYNNQLGNLANSLSPDPLSTGIKDTILQLEEIQLNACGKILQLKEENQNLKSERLIADVSLSSAKSEMLAMNQKFKGEIQGTLTKLNVSNALVAKLQAEIESVANKLQFSSEIEEKYFLQNKILLADLALLEDQMQELTCESGHLSRQFSGLDNLAEELGRGKSTITELVLEKQELVMSLQDKTEESIKLASEVGCLKEELRNLRDDLHKKKTHSVELEERVKDFTSQLNKERNAVLDFELKNVELLNVRKLASDLEQEKLSLAHHLEQQNSENESLRREIHDKQQLVVSLQADIQDSVKLASEIDRLKEDLRILHDELRKENTHKDELEERVKDLTSQLNKGKDELFSFEQQKVELLNVSKLASDLEQEKSRLAHHLEQQNSINESLQKEIDEKQQLVSSLQDEIEKSVKRATEIDSLKEDLRILHDELQNEKLCKGELEGEVRDLTSQLKKDNDELFDLMQQTVELLHVRKLASDLEVEKSRLVHLLEQQNMHIEKLQKELSCQASLESQLLEMHDYSLATDVKLVYFANQYESSLEELLEQLVSSEGCLVELQKRYNELEATLSHHLASKTQLSEEKANLLTTLDSLRSDLEVSEAQNKLLTDSKNEIMDQLEKCNEKLKMMETSSSMDKSQQASAVEQMKDILTDAEEEISSLYVSTVELDISVILLKSKVIENCKEATLLDEYRDEVMKLRLQCSELSQKLSEQVLKTEEFKNLATHLKDLKDKAEAECLQARERKEGPSVAAQDSLRIAFIKEQYETRVQELKHQLSISKKHGEEMLMKLQDSIDEIENRKKSEAVNLKRNEELSLRLSALEAELQSALAEKREKIIAYDRTKAEVECALLSLECCKEEKQKLEASLQEIEAEKSKLIVELTLLKRNLENLKSSTNMKDKFGSMSEIEFTLNGSTGSSSPISLEQEGTIDNIKREDAISILARESADPIEPIHLQIAQDLTSKVMDQDPVVLGVGESPKSIRKTSDVNGERVTQILRSSMEHLHKELERMKNENIAFSEDHDAAGHQVPQEIMQLHKTNEELRSMFPSFNEISGGENALESVLALEIELAEALKAKNKQNILFQSSFLKQHSDEEAVLKSFRDINELIKEMLELKGRHATMEAELRDMHDRYSQLSLHFAEVEGERQQLKMTLKNVRSSRRLLRSSSTDTDNPS